MKVMAQTFHAKERINRNLQTKQRSRFREGTRISRFRVYFRNGLACEARPQIHLPEAAQGETLYSSDEMCSHISFMKSFWA